MNKQDAIRQFVAQEFNNIPLSLLEKAYPNLYENIVPLVEPKPEDYELEDDSEPIEPVEDDFTDEVSYFDESAFQIAKEEYEDAKERYEQYTQAYQDWESQTSDYYPMWGTIFECNSSWMNSDIKEKLKEVQDIGFIVMDDFDELNVCLGVGGCGYDFYEAHWSKLYDLLRLQWHSNEDKE